MKNIKGIIKLVLGFAVFTAVILYFSFLFLLPKNINTDKNIRKCEELLSQTTGFHTNLDGFKFNSNPNLTFDIKVKKTAFISKEKEELIKIDNLKYHASVLNIKHGKLNSDYIFADINLLKKYLNQKSKNDKKLDLSYFPIINIKSGKIIFTPKTYAKIENIKSVKHHGKISTSIFARIINPYTKHPITVGEKGTINYKNKLDFDNFSIKFGSSEIYLFGDTDNLKIKGKDLPVKELEEGFLYFYKLKHPNKKNFIENFANFKGSLDVDLGIKKGNFNGECTAKNLGADFSTLKIPVFLPETIFYFKDKTIKAKTQGIFGTEPVKTDVVILGAGTDKLDVLGNVESDFTNRLVKKYYPNVEIQGHTPAKVTYHTHQGKVDVYYYLTIPKGNNLLSVWGNLDNTDKTRKITMHTEKHGIPMEIKELEYCAVEQNQCNKLLYGDGLINKTNGKYTLYNLNLKTNGKISVNYIKSFLRDYIKNGTFDADVKLDFIKKNMLGFVNLYNISNDKNLILQNTSLNVNKDEIIINTNGKLYSSPIIASAIVANKFQNNKILVKSIDMHLNSLFLQKGKLQFIPKNFKTNKITTAGQNRKKKPDIEIEQGRVVVDRIYGRRFDVRNVNFQGALRNNIASFIIPKAEYAGGLLSAKGIYNTKNYSSDIQFFASDINSNEVATQIFKLPDQIEGEAFATLHIITKNKFNDIKAKATFAVSDGYLPKIGTQEFIIKNDKNKKPSKIAKFIEKHNIKLTLSNITNIDFSEPEKFNSNLYGSFNMYNDEVKNVHIFSKSKIVGLYIEGDYNIETECGDINIFGKRNKTEAKKIRIFKIPINLIYKVVFRPEHSAEYYSDKVTLIPDIPTKITDDIAIFRVNVKGNFNKKEKLNITLKDIR